MKNLRYRKSLLFLLMLAVMMPVLTVGATQATRDRHRELQQQVQDAERQVREQRNLLAGTRYEMSALTLEMMEMDLQMMETSVALESIELSLLDTEIRIADAEIALEASREEYDIQFEIFRTRVREIHEQGSLGFLGVLFQAESIVDFFARWEDIRVVAQFDRELLARLEAQEAYIAAQIEDLNRWRNMVVDLQFAFEREYDNLNFLLEKQQARFAELAEDEAALAELVAIMEESARVSRAEFSDIQARLQREQDQIARDREAARRAERLAHLNNFDGNFRWPIPTHSHISSPFGMRRHPITRRNQMHTGIDVPAPTGTRVVAAADGVVRFAGWSGGYGLTVIIDHGNGYSTLYAHHSRNRVEAGQSVTRGQHIADVGSTGVSTGPHLHFEIRINNSHVNPMRYFGG